MKYLVPVIAILSAIACVVVLTVDTSNTEVAANFMKSWIGLVTMVIVFFDGFSFAFKR